eukprot:XP_011681599.1 PREDICTED: probable serine/threonine-protein kinase DDB_G0278665 [Strongylocentrotus purpuratus]
MALEAGCDEVDARLSVHQLDEIMMADLTVKDSTGRKCTFHEKKAREHEGCHLGGGSFGEVYKAVHKVHGDVAVKLAKPGKEDQVVLMYQKEAGKHVLSLTSNHIVSIKGFVQCEKAACDCGCLIGIVMEYMKHGSLWDFRISKWQDRPDLWPLTNRMVHQISSGMHFLHSKDIIHRDLKLENVLVDGNLNVKVADLGLATNLQTSFGDERCGTNSHKPPEAFRTDLPNSTKVVTPEYDVYSFAMTLYELLTGIHPYSDRGFYMMMLLKVDSKQSPCLQPIPASTPEDLIRVMEESWSYEPNDRPNFREITEWVANLDTEPTHESLGHYLGEQRSPENVGRADDEPVRRGMQDLPVNDPTPVEQSNGNAAIPITETETQNQVEGHESPPTHPIIQKSSYKKEGLPPNFGHQNSPENVGRADHEPVRRGMQDLPINDPTPVEQSNGNAAIPITETETQNQVEGHESPPTHPIIQRSSSKKEGLPPNFGHQRSPENVGRADDEPVRRGMQDLPVNDPTPVEQSNGNAAIPITETETQNQVEGHESPPTHPIIQRSSTKKEGKKDDKSVGRGMKNLTLQEQARARHQSNTNAAVHDIQTVIHDESVRKGMEGLTMNDHTPVEQSNGKTAIPINETVTQHQVEGQESPPTHLGQDNVVAPLEIQHSQPSSQDPSKPSSFGRLKSQISGPQYRCHGDIFQPTVEAEQPMEFTGFVSAPTENSPDPSASQPLKSYRKAEQPTEFTGFVSAPTENSPGPSESQPLKSYREAEQPMEFTGFVSASTENSPDPSESQPLKSYRKAEQPMEFTGFVSAPTENSPGLSASQPLKSYREAEQPMEFTGFVSAPTENSPGLSESQPLKSYREAEQLMEFTGFVSAPTENSPDPSESQPLKSYREDGKPVPVESSHGNTEYAVAHTAGGPIHQESPVVAPSQPSSTERDPTIIFDSSQPSDEDFEIKVKVRLNIQLRASMASKLDQIFICLERCKHRDYWDSNSSLSTMFSWIDITLKSLQLPATVDDDDFTLYFRVCNKRDLDKLHKLSEKGHLRQSLYYFFVDVHLKEVCLPAEPDLKVESWEEQFNKGMAHFQKKEKANESMKSDSERSEPREKQQNETKSGASFSQTNCSGATQINTGNS